ncbi:MAG: FesM [Anaerolineae bacterium]|nr:FesM [Anaerolineae bacterium]
MSAASPVTRFDALRLPGLRRVARMPRGRLVFQLPMLLFALLLMYDGFSGPQRAGQNLATVAPWVHYRGLVVLALLLAGNLFCAACPFALPRTVAHRLSVRGRRWPRILRGKWVAAVSLLALFFVYEWLDLWASPLLTAWLIAAYFAAAFALEAFFTESAFCKYVCPLGTFNFVYSTASPLQIGVRQPDVCRTCVGKDCINGRYAAQPVIRVSEITTSPPIPVFVYGEGAASPASGGEVAATINAKSFDSAPSTQHSALIVPGCGTLLFPPTIQSNLDCTLCLDCARACPHDNVGLFARAPGAELKKPNAWPARWDVSLLVICLAFLGLLNAFGMTPPVYDLLEGLANSLGLPGAGLPPAAIDAIVLGLLFVAVGVVLPAGLSVGAAALSRRLGGVSKRDSLRHTVAAFAPAFVPIGLGFWIAHYSFHFLTGLFTIVPVTQRFLTDHQIGWFGAPDWSLGGLPLGVVGMIQLSALIAGYGVSMWLALQTAQRLYRRNAMLGYLAWALLLTGLMLAGWWLIQQPMEMRGSFLFD